MQSKSEADEKFSDRIHKILDLTGTQLTFARRSYGESWINRGGVGAFMNLARKWDRVSQACERAGWDILKALEMDRRPEGLIDDLRDLRDYCILVDEYWTRGSEAPQYIKEVAPLRDDDPVHPQADELDEDTYEDEIRVRIVRKGDGSAEVILPVHPETVRLNIIQEVNKNGI